MKMAITECIKRDTMKEFLEKHGSEVYNMLFREFNIEDAMRVRREEGREEQQ